MDLLGAALPNLMFLVGILAIGLGLGIELKIVSLNKQIDKTGRIGAIVVGIMLIGASVLMYANPALIGRGQPAPSATPVSPLQAALVAAPTSDAPDASPAPAEPTPGATAESAPPAATMALGAATPNLHGKSEREAQDALIAAGLKPQRADACTGPDTADPKPKKGRVMCQNPPAGQVVAPGSSVVYVLKR